MKPIIKKIITTAIPYIIKWIPALFKKIKARIAARKAKRAKMKISDFPDTTKPADELKIKQPLKIEYSDDCSGRFSNVKTLEMVKTIGAALGADLCIVTGADRSEDVHDMLIITNKTRTAYENTQHGEIMGYKAADVKYFINKKQIESLVVATVAEITPIIGGVGVYSGFTHIDHRDRKPDGTAAKWGLWSV